MSKDIKKVLLCGLGAVGMVYAAKFQEHDSGNFKVLVDKERLKRYLEHPPELNGKPFHFNYLLPNDNEFKADLILITTKITGLNAVIRDIKNFVKEDTVIIPLLNGVTSEQIVADFYGWERVLYGYFIGHSAVRNNNKVCHDGVGTLYFGAGEPHCVNVLRVKEFFERVKINYVIPEDIKRSLWLKFMLNVCANPPTALLRMTFGQMLENNNFMHLAQKIMGEVQAIAKAEGVNNTETMLDETIANLKLMCPEGKTSMFQDVEANRKTEIDIFAGTVVELGNKHSIPTPYCSLFLELFNIIHESFDKLESQKNLKI